jgi:selenide,water dikinase
MTDVTGFGLLGHLSELCAASDATAEIDFGAVPMLHDAVETYRAQGCVPGGTKRNWASYGHHIAPITDAQRQILCDPQTSGGLLIAVGPDALAEFHAAADLAGLSLSPIGRVVAPGEHRVVVQ